MEVEEAEDLVRYG